jgi:hypothetical protein
MTDEMIAVEDYLQDCWAALKDRARYMALVVQELDARGLDTDDIISTAIRRYGVEMGKKAGRIDGADEFIRSQMSSRLGRRAFKTERGEMTPKRAVLMTHHCPLVETWKDMGLSDAEVSRMCDLFENRDEGRVEAVGIGLEVPQTIARGDPICKFVFTKE